MYECYQLIVEVNMKKEGQTDGHDAISVRVANVKS